MELAKGRPLFRTLFGSNGTSLSDHVVITSLIAPNLDQSLIGTNMLGV